MCRITQEDIDSGAVIVLNNGLRFKIKASGKVYQKDDCELEDDLDISTPHKMHDEGEETPPSKQKKEKKQKNSATSHPKKQDHQIPSEEETPSDKTEELIDDKEMIDMGLPVLAPQDSNGGSAPTTITPEQMNLLLQTLGKMQQPQPQPQIQPQAPAVATTPVQQATPSKDALPGLTTEIQKTAIPEELHLFKQFMELTGGNALVAVLLVGIFVYMKFLKGNVANNQASEEKNKEQDERIGEHTDVCDTERKELNQRVSHVEGKLATVDSKLVKVSSLEDKNRKILELDKRLSELEEHLENGLELSLSDEVEHRLSNLEKQIKNLAKDHGTKEVSGTKASTQTTTLKKAKNNKIFTENTETNTDEE